MHPEQPMAGRGVDLNQPPTAVSRLAMWPVANSMRCAPPLRLA